MGHDETALRLPTSIVSRVDIARVAREVEAIGSYVEQTERGKARGENRPTASAVLQDLLTTNGLDMASQANRERLYHFLIELKRQAPVMHFSFAVNPSPDFTAKLISWIRKELHPMVLLDIGLQPTIGAGCVLRTNSKYFDFSMRQHLLRQRQVLIDKLHMELPTYA